MGSILSRRIAGVEDIDIQANSAYRYPPKSGERPAPTPGADGLAAGGVGKALPLRALRAGVGGGLCLAHGPPCLFPPGAPRALALDPGACVGPWGDGLVQAG